MNPFRKIAKWAGIVTLALLLLAAILPFLIPITPLENLHTPQSIAQEDSQFVTIPFAGTDGSVLALQAAHTHPDRVEALILADSAVYIQESIPAGIINLPQVQKLGPLFGRMIGSSESFVRQTYLDPAAIDDTRMRLTLIHTEVNGWDEAMWEYLQEWSVSPIDLTGKLSTISQPALVITGDNDKVVPVGDSARLANTLPNAQYAVLTTCGHVPQEECPERFEDTLNAWLTEHNQ
ncbi:MAG: alpha/beta hydrolase [Candidatus Promineifilaceae bacterium]|nr:alpha/beta hydrolase [Candidatus Promineifilaceae bacterium]